MFYKINFTQVSKQRFFNQALKYSGFLVFAIVTLGDIKRDNLATKDFQKCGVRW